MSYGYAMTATNNVFSNFELLVFLKYFLSIQQKYYYFLTIGNILKQGRIYLHYKYKKSFKT